MHSFFGMLLPLMFLCKAAGAQSITTLPNPYLENKNTTGEKLYFLPATGAVETTSGKKILKPGLMMLLSDYDVPEVELGATYFDLMDTAGTRPDTGMHFDYRFCTFNVKGELLYHAFLYDNGPDYWKEGRRRFVEAEKMGLVNRLGQRTVPASRYSFITPLREGYAIGCLDCVYTVFDSTDLEHGAGWKGSQYEIIDQQGKVFHRYKAADLDSALNVLALRRQYKAPQIVARLKAQLQAFPETKAAEKTLHMPAGSMEYVCYDEPTALSPYYHFALEDTSGSGVFPPVQFLVSPDDKTFLHIGRQLDKVTPYEFWRTNRGKWEE